MFPGYSGNSARAGCLVRGATALWPNRKATKAAKGTRGCIFRSTRVPAGFSAPFSAHQWRRGTSHSATSSQDLIMQSGGPLRPFALSFFSLFLRSPGLLPLSPGSKVLFSPRTRRRPIKSHWLSPNHPVEFHLHRIFIGIIPAVYENWKCSLPRDTRRDYVPSCLHVSFRNFFDLSSCIFLFSFFLRKLCRKYSVYNMKVKGRRFIFVLSFTLTVDKHWILSSR